jgi:hypothetical protein
MDYRFVGHFYHGHIILEGKSILDDFFLVVDEYDRPTVGYATTCYCLLMSITSGDMHEVHFRRLSTAHYRRVA